jgi:hypothetical protein
MKLKALSLGAAIGFILATVASCGTPAGNCGPNNCTGCCNAGTCVAPDKLTDSTCGSSGNACTNCAASSQTCNMTTKSCIGSVATGGGTSGTGGGTSGTGGGTSSTGGGTSSTGGGTAGGSMGTGGGMSGLMPCDFTAPNCPAGSECLLNDVNGTAGKCVPGQCSVVVQDCTAPNTKCIVGPVPDGGLARQCAPFQLGDGGVNEGAACTPAVADPCQKGAQCIGSTASNATCRRYCAPISGCGPGSECNLGITFTLMSGPTNELHLVCSPITACDPYTQMPCQAMEACQLYRSGAPAGCLPSGPVMGGGQCSGSNLCARGFQCVVSGVGGVMGNCRAFCNLDGGAPACTAGMCQNLMNSGTGACSM